MSESTNKWTTRTVIFVFIFLAALVHGLSLPKFSMFYFGFIFLVPLLFLVKADHPRFRVKKAFLVFFSFSFFSYMLVLNWIPNVVEFHGGGSRVISIVGLMALSAFLSLFTGLAGSLIKRLPLYMIPVIWTARDLWVEKIFGGFPWCQSGYSQHTNLYFIQVAEWGGIHLITFLLIAFNVLLFRLITRRDKHTAAAIVTSLVFIYSTGYFLVQSNHARIAGLETHKAGIIQPNTDNTFRPRSVKEIILKRLFYQSRLLEQQGAEFILWPEHTVSLYPMQSKADFAYFQQHMQQSSVPLLAGYTHRENYKKIYNSYFIFQQEGIQRYDKVHLAPFGEYIPFRKLFSFVQRITDEIGDFTPGPGEENLLLLGHKVATPICYEIIFPELVKEFISRGGELIITGSNDSWFGNSSAKYQHLAMAVFRSIENRRYILRTTTNGISGVIEPSGKLAYRSPHNREDYFIGEFKYIRESTLFIRYGYLFPYLCVIVLFGYFIFVFFNRKKF